MAAVQDTAVDQFLQNLVRQSITSFVLAVTSNRELTAAFCQIDQEPEAIAAFARTKGYVFRAEDLKAFVEDRIAARLTPAEVEDRRRFFRRRADGRAPGPQDIEAETVPRLASQDVGPGFVLDRQEVLEGGVLALRQVPGLGSLIERIGAILRAVLGQEDLETVHRHLDFPTLRKRIEVAYEGLSGDAAIPGIMVRVIAALGLDPQRTLFEWPGFRVMWPETQGGHGFYRTSYSGALGPHRDTWYGSPQHQMNFWGPVCRLDPDATLRVLPRFYRRRVANSSRGYDAWRNYAGLCLAPGPRETVSTKDAIAPELSVGDMVCFAAHQLHASAVNTSGRTRVSFEFRLLCRDDEGAAYMPPNIDYYGNGEIYKGWFDANGREVMRLQPEG